MAEARWAHEQARERELGEVVEFFADLELPSSTSSWYEIQRTKTKLGVPPSFSCEFSTKSLKEFLHVRKSLKFVYKQDKHYKTMRWLFNFSTEF